MKKRIDPYGIPNVNFSIFNPKDDRADRFKKERLERGFDESETWDLRTTLARFALPRVKEYLRIVTFQGENKEHIKDVKDIIVALELIANDEVMVEEKVKKVKKGLKKLGDNWLGLWW
ncbi:MAG: hypothetical protein WC511_01905 [Candidatus Pacearchaeota archaeon]